MPCPDEFPPDYAHRLAALEDSYLASSDPLLQSGYGGGPVRWRQDRGPILEAISASGDFLDAGCANGYLLECLVAWAAERGLTLTPYGLDLGSRLIEVARRRLPQLADHFFVGNAWDWQPPRRFDYVYALHDNVPEACLADYVRRLLERMVTPGGRLIMGAYGSRSRQHAPIPIDDRLEAAGFSVAGSAHAGDPVITRFAWIDHPPR